LYIDDDDDDDDDFDEQSLLDIHGDLSPEELPPLLFGLAAMAV
jgi:hypothetical protein